MSAGGLSDLAGELNAIIESLDSANGSCTSLREMGDEILKRIAQTTEGSENDHVIGALAQVANAQIVLEDASKAFCTASEALESYMSEKGLG